MLHFFADISPHGGGRANHVPISTVADKVAFDKKVAAKNQLEKTMSENLLQIEKEFLAKLSAKHPEIKIVMPKKDRPVNGIILADSRKTPQTWEYSFKKPADHWFEIAFDDSKWKKGPAGFGTKGTPGSVVRTTWNQREIWMRIDFGLTEIPAKLTMSVHHDEDAEIYLNGKQIATLKGYIGSYKTMDVTAAALDAL